MKISARKLIKGILPVAMFASFGTAVNAGVSSADGLGTSWLGTPTYVTYANPNPLNNPNGAFVSEGNWGSGGLAQGFTLSTGGTLSDIQVTLAGVARTFNIFLYDLGPASGYVQNGSATFTPGTTLFSSMSLQVTYNAGAGGAQNVMQMTFSGADAVSLLPNQYYAFVMQPTTPISNDTFWTRGGATPNPGGQAYRLGQFSAGQYGALNGGVREMGFAVTVVPEPSTVALTGLALSGLFMMRRRRA